MLFRSHVVVRLAADDSMAALEQFAATVLPLLREEDLA